MDGLKIIKTKEAYEAALNELDRLMDLDPQLGTEESDRLDVLALLIKNFEDVHFHIDLPDPVSAIKFRMEQEGLKNQDLVPYLGSKTRVSQVLNYKRDLTLKQARALHKGLGIPAEVILREFPKELAVEDPNFTWSKMPVLEMVNRNWINFNGTPQAIKERAEELVRPFITSCDAASALCRRGQGVDKDPYGLIAYIAGMQYKVSKKRVKQPYKPENLKPEVIQGLVQLSSLKLGPQMVEDYLSNYGIHFVTIKHFKKTHLDGAAMLLADNTPVIALTLRHDRLDNFWFTLLHELAHVKLHLTGESSEPFFDDLDAAVDDCEIEEEANNFAAESLFPQDEFNKYPKSWTAHQVKKVALERGISSAIIAGKVQKLNDNYRMLHQLVGRGEVRKLFPHFDH